ncbi:MAG: Bug family tripartite tricarboxylate transporter substrate binding protein [Rhodospirillaceae bacterium]
MKHHGHRWAAICAACAWALAFAAQAQPDSYPARPIRILVPFPAGGAADTVARTIGEQLAQKMGQPVVVDNRPGAGGRLATELLAKAEPDGYTVLVGTVGGIAVSPAHYKNLPYDPQRDIASITRVAEILNVMVLNPSSGARNVREFIDWAKKRGEVRFGSSGTGQPDHIAGEFFERLAGIKMTHVPYKGGGPALVDLVSGDIQLTFSTYIVALPHIQSGRLRAVAVTTEQRQPLLPDLPAISETVPGFGVSNWEGMFAPGRTPPRILDRLHSEINAALKAPELKKKQQGAGIDPQGSATREEFVKFVREDTQRWAKLVRDANIHVD